MAEHRTQPSAARFATRFAPSPTGYLHLGHAYSALAAFAAAQEASGRFILRIEDTDLTRCRPEYETGIYHDLSWLGLAWEAPVLRQSERLNIYRRALERLQDFGVLYRCFLSRQELRAAIVRDGRGRLDGPDGPVFFGGSLPEAEAAAKLAAGAPFAWRVSVEACRRLLGAEADALTFHEEGAGPDGETGEIVADAALLGDAVIGRKDTGVSYHLAAVIDDAAQGVTHVIRGVDVFPSTHLHRLLQRLLDLPTPVYRHHSLVLGRDGRRFAKSDGSVTLQALRAAGWTPDDVRRRVGLLPGPAKEEPHP
ncbi:MAG: tRNA glutamyl-Q(34) synthetase GluQRS [Pseudomonadota bacterium]